MREHTVNVAKVTRELLDLIMKLPGTEKADMLKRLAPDISPKTGGNAAAATTTALIDTVMRLDTDRRCRVLGELKTIDGSSNRRYSRIDFFSPVQYVVNGRLGSGFIKNISINGVFIEDPHFSGPRPGPGNTATMIFDHPHTGNHTKVRGEIVRVTKGGLGIRFEEKI